MMKNIPCKLCGSRAYFAGEKQGKYRARTYCLYHCGACHFSFIQNPDRDFSELYSKDYYEGKGADPLVNYSYELHNQHNTVRIYEWQGIVKAVGSLTKLNPQLRWLDYGCGNGGLVRFCRNARINAFGFEEGWIKNEAIRDGIPLLNESELKEYANSFDVVTAIEVLEHVENPLIVLKSIHSLLKPDGIFFYTTGNAKPFRRRLLQWDYLVPEVHISLFEPETLASVLETAGFIPSYHGFLPGFADIIRFKILKNLKCHTVNWFEKSLPWNVISRIVDCRYRLAAHPIARAKG